MRKGVFFLSVYGFKELCCTTVMVVSEKDYHAFVNMRSTRTLTSVNSRFTSVKLTLVNSVSCMPSLIYSEVNECILPSLLCSFDQPIQIQIILDVIRHFVRFL